MMSSSNLCQGYPQACHPQVERIALRSLHNLPRYLDSPMHEPSVDAFAAAAKWLDQIDESGQRPLILDSGCGTGRSTCMLAHSNPEAAVIGVDRSEMRLNKASHGPTPQCGPEPLPSNALLVRAELATFWRLLLREDLGIPNSSLAASRVSSHMLLYPNPYPKASRLNLRWHGHPALPLLLGLGGTLEVRSNWRVYLEEHRTACRCLADDASFSAASHGAAPATWKGHASASASSTAIARLCAGRISARGVAMRRSNPGSELVELPALRHEDNALTLFERKFAQQGEKLYRLKLS